MKAYLTITTWVGTSVYGASHYFGRLRIGKEEIDVERPLSQSDARQLNVEQAKQGGDYLRWEPGQDCGRFFSEEAVCEAAVAMLKDRADVKYLFKGASCVLDPQPVLIGPEPFKTKMNELVAQAEVNDWWEGDEDQMGVIYNTWTAAMKAEGLRT